MLQLSSRLQYVTIRIVGARANGTTSVGTGFFFHFAFDSDRFIPVIVTNHHVIKDCVEGEFHLHEARGSGTAREPTGASFSVKLDRFEQRWLRHLTEDLCVMLFEPLRAAATAHIGKEPFWIAFDETVIPSDDTLRDLGAMEDVVMVGYPIGLWDHVNNLPLIRRGVTASHPMNDWQGRCEGVVDIGAFAGSSGSPILIFNQGTYATGGGTVIGSRMLLLGTMTKVPLYKVDGTIVIQAIPTAAVPITQTPVPTHLGYYIKARELMAMKPQLLALVQQPNPGTASSP
jgi:hypothetical protein